MLLAGFAILFLILYAAFPAFRCACWHPFLFVYCLVRDSCIYLKHHDYDRCPVGALDVYTGYFGRGKTLSVVHKVCSLYRRYNGRMVWSPYFKGLVRQRVVVLSNVSLNIPFTPLTSLPQITTAGLEAPIYDKENKTLTVTLVLMDELSVQMNSRDFKKNFNAYFLNTLLCCRHYRISFFGTSQRFEHCDKLLRDVSQNVIQCKKIGRFQTLYVYDAWDVEHASNTELIKPKSVQAWFVRDKDFEAYDTLAVVDNIRKSVEKGDMLSEADILSAQGNSPAFDVDCITNPSRKLRRMRKSK